MKFQTSKTCIQALFFIGLVGLSCSSEAEDSLKREDPQAEFRDFGGSLPPIFDGTTGTTEWLDRIKVEMQAAFDRIKAVNEELQQRIIPARESVKAKVSAAGQRVVESIRQGTEHGTSTSTSSFTTMSSDGKGPAVGSKNVVTKTTTFEQHFP